MSEGLNQKPTVKKASFDFVEPQASVVCVHLNLASILSLFSS